MVVMVEDHMVVVEVHIAQVCIQLVYYLVSVCFVKEEINGFCVGCFYDP